MSQTADRDYLPRHKNDNNGAEPSVTSGGSVFRLAKYSATAERGTYGSKEAESFINVTSLRSSFNDKVQRLRVKGSGLKP